VWRHAFICLCHALVCSIDAPAESSGVIVLWSIVWDRYACIQSYMGLSAIGFDMSVCPSARKQLITKFSQMFAFFRKYCNFRVE